MTPEQLIAEVLMMEPGEQQEYELSKHLEVLERMQLVATIMSSRGTGDRREFSLNQQGNVVTISCYLKPV